MFGKRKALLSSRSAAMPPGALGMWDVSRGFVKSPRLQLKNMMATSGLLDSNYLSLPRTAFGAGQPNHWTNSGGLTISDSSQTAPDGSGDASAVSNTVAASWQLQSGTMNVPAGTYTIAVSLKSLSGSSISANLRITNATVPTAAITITTAWQRFTFTGTLTSPGTCTAAVFAPSSIVNFAVCDFEFFAGSSDLNPNPMGAAPISIQNGDVLLGTNHGDANNTVLSNGLLNNLAFGLGFLPTAQTMSAWTVAFGFSPASTAGNSIQLLLSNRASWADFGIGPAVDTYTLNGPASLRWNGSYFAYVSASGANYITSGNSWGNVGNGFTTMVVRYDRSVLSTFVNGLKVQECAVSLGTARVLRALSLNLNASLSASGLSIGLGALYMRAVSNIEAAQIHKHLIYKFGQVGNSRLIGLTGTSISAFLPSHYSIMAASLSPKRLLSSQATPSATTATATTAQMPYLNALVCNGPDQNEYVLLSEMGTNDLLAEINAGGTTGSVTIAALAAYLDAARASGWQKIVQTTIMSRNDVGLTGGHTQAQFDTARALVNSAILGWVGSRVTAVADWASDPTMGPNGACNNATNFQTDKVHPNATGSGLLAPITAAALNSI